MTEFRGHRTSEYRIKTRTVDIGTLLILRTWIGSLEP